MDVALFLGAPACEHLLRLRHHHPAVGGDALAVEGGLGQPALAQPEVALAGEQAVSEDGVHVAPEEAVLLELRVARDEHVLDQIGVVDQAGGMAGQAQADHVAVAARAVLEEAQEVAREFGKVPEKQMAGRARSGRRSRRDRDRRRAPLRARVHDYGVPHPRIAVAAPSCSRASARSTAASSMRTLPLAASGASCGSNS